MDSELHPNKYLIRGEDLKEAQWGVANHVPLKLSASIGSGLVLATKERKMWYEDQDGKVVNSLWVTRFYIRGDATPFFWFSKHGDNIGNLEIQHLNENLIKRIGEIEWVMIKWNTLKG